MLTQRDSLRPAPPCQANHVLIPMYPCELDTAGSGSAQALAKPFTWTSPVLKPCCAEPLRSTPHMWYTGNLHVDLLLVAVTACAAADAARFARDCVQALTRVRSLTRTMMHAVADETRGFLQPAMNNLAYLLEKHVKQYDEAEQLYRQALDIEPHNVILLCNLAGVFPLSFSCSLPHLTSVSPHVAVRIVSGRRCPPRCLAC